MQQTTTTVVMYDGADAEQLSEFQQRIEQAERSGNPLRIGDDDPDAEALRAEAREFAEGAVQRAEVWHLGAIGHLEYAELTEQHPARFDVREGNGLKTDDRDWPGFNTATFPMALLRFMDENDDEIRTVLKIETADGEADLSDRALTKRLKRLSLGQFTKLWMAAYQLNEVMPADPKDVMRSVGSVVSTGTSTSPVRLG